jgi:folate-dependent tRNA-U54 methylase TrmFO/GidA
MHAEMRLAGSLIMACADGIRCRPVARWRSIATVSPMP